MPDHPPDPKAPEEVGKGFATTPYPLTYGGPQMEDYADWDAWYFARQEWVMRRMLAQADARRARSEAEG